MQIGYLRTVLPYFFSPPRAGRLMGAAIREVAVSRRVYLLGLALVALALAVTDWALSLQPGVTWANACRLKRGMTFVEVERLLGPSSYGEIGQGALLAHWEGESCSVVVAFDRHGRAIDISFFPGRSPSDVPSRLRAWLSW
jgi:hypothetical protein